MDSLRPLHLSRFGLWSGVCKLLLPTYGRRHSGPLGSSCEKRPSIMRVCAVIFDDEYVAEETSRYYTDNCSVCVRVRDRAHLQAPGVPDRSCNEEHSSSHVPTFPPTRAARERGSLQRRYMHCKNNSRDSQNNGTESITVVSRILFQRSSGRRWQSSKPTNAAPESGWQAHDNN